MIDEAPLVPNPDKPQAKEDFFVVAIGGGAGSHEGIQVFFQNHLSNVNAAFVLVNVPSYSRALKPDLFSQFPKLKVEEVKPGTLLQPGHVYLLPNNQEFVLHKKSFKVKEHSSEKPNQGPLDAIFSSLAEQYRTKTVGILLSGTGADGLAGLKQIKENDGLVMVQVPESARFPELPEAAISAGLADHVLTPRDLAQELGQYFYHSQLLNGQEELQKEQNENRLSAILELIKAKTAYDFTGYKKPTLLRRTIRRMALNKVPDIAAYAQFLQTHPQEVHTLSRDFLIGVTRFFRDREVFEALQRLVVPELVRNNQKRNLIKAWSIGCSTGEEAYTLAILFREFLDLHGKSPEVKIFATDIDEVAISTASKGVFSREVGSSRVDLQACKLEYSIVSPK